MRIRAKADEPLPVPGSDGVTFEEALDAHRERLGTLLPEPDWRDVEARARTKAFWVAGVAQLDLVTETWSAVDKALADGTTLADFKKDIGAKLQAAWQGTVASPAVRLETIFRTNVQTAYNAGRWYQTQAPAVQAVRPFGRFDAVLDSRTTPECEVADGTVLRLSDPWWKSHWPPLRFQCRSTVVTLDEDEAAEEGVTATPPAAPAGEGFGQTPDVAAAEQPPGWATKKLDEAPEQLRQAAAAKGL
jgi:SPP1 gp7 family putative phage head morphogenesis protein